MGRRNYFRISLPVLFSFLLILTASSDLLAQDHVDYGIYTHWHKTVELDFNPTTGIMRGDQLLFLDTASRLQVIDTTDPFDPQPIAAVAFEGQPKRLAVDGDLACIAAGDGGLLVFDISDLEHPVQLGRVPAFNALRVAMVGSHAYVGDHTSYLRVVDLADPSDPVIIATLFLGTVVQFIVAGPGHVYCLDDDGLLRTIDISDPADPV